MIAGIVIFLSIGMNISKIKCTDGGQLYLGKDVPSCSTEKEVDCKQEQEKVNCCVIEVRKQCCPETKDKSCSSETENIQFDFETLVTVFEVDFSVAPVLLFAFNLTDCFNANYNLQTYLSDMPPPKLHKPVLSRIQSFLL